MIDLRKTDYIGNITLCVISDVDRQAPSVQSERTSGLLHTVSGGLNLIMGATGCICPALCKPSLNKELSLQTLNPPAQGKLTMHSQQCACTSKLWPNPRLPGQWLDPSRIFLNNLSAVNRLRFVQSECF